MLYWAHNVASMKAMILAAGRGTRLKPLTDYRPKALVKVGDHPLLEIVIRQLIHNGFNDIIINIHHFGDQVQKFLERNDNFGINISLSDEQDALLNTGGGLKKAKWFLDDGDPFLLCNTDILTDMNLKELYNYHCDNKAIATLPVRRRDTSRYLVADEKMRLSGWCNTKDHVMKMCRSEVGNFELLAFSGVHVIDPAIFELMPDEEVFSIIDLYLGIADQHPINLIRHDDDSWLDVGTPESLEKAPPIAEKILAKTT